MGLVRFFMFFCKKSLMFIKAALVYAMKYYYNLKCITVMAKLHFLSAITPVYSVTWWHFRKHVRQTASWAGLGQWKLPSIPDLQPSVWRSGYARLLSCLLSAFKVHQADSHCSQNTHTTCSVTGSDSWCELISYSSVWAQCSAPGRIWTVVCVERFSWECV